MSCEFGAELYSERAQQDLATCLTNAQHAPLDAKLA
jgi:hypothetical protein